MLKTNSRQVEKFYDVLSQTTNQLVKLLKKDYFSALTLSANFILEGEVVEDDLSTDAIEELTKTYTKLEHESFNKEEIRKSFQLCLLQGLKYENQNLSLMTPDSIGLIFALLVDFIFPDKQPLNILDASVGTGNLLFTMLNNSQLEINNLFGVDPSYKVLEVALAQADLLNYDIELIHQDSRNPIIVPDLDLIIADLPDTDEAQDLSYRIVENLLKYASSGGYFIFTIPNDFFTRPGNEQMKQAILQETYMHALIALPQNMFKTIEAQKSILILHKRGENIAPTKDILVFNFPSFQDKPAVQKAVTQLENWFKQIKE